MEPAIGGRALLGIGPDAPPPTGDLDPRLKAAMLAQLKASNFRLRVQVWSVVCHWRSFPWEEFARRLNAAEFRRYRKEDSPWRSAGWSGLASDKQKWLFAVSGYGIPLYGKSAMRHELFHAAQDLLTGLFHSKKGTVRHVRRCVLAEFSAHLWGGPLIGLCLYGLILLVLLGAHKLGIEVVGLYHTLSAR